MWGDGETHRTRVIVSAESLVKAMATALPPEQNKPLLPVLWTLPGPAPPPPPNSYPQGSGISTGLPTREQHGAVGGRKQNLLTAIEP